MRSHTPVLLKEVTEFLAPMPGKKYIDATLGMGGHSKELLRLGAKVLGIDRDSSVIPDVIRDPVLDSRLRGNNMLVVAGNFSDLKAIAEKNAYTDVDGILFDLGLGSHQLDDGNRGFSFQNEGPLDMRFNQKSEVGDRKSETAAQIVNFYPEKELIRIFYKYGEEKRFGKRVSRAILIRRKEGGIETTTELFEIIKHALPGKLRFKTGDTARKIFQALRIEVNRELENLQKGLQQALTLLRDGGRLVVISFHSLEDRTVKQFFALHSKDCVCPPSFPVCVCDARASLRILTKKPIMAQAEEIKINSRAASAKLRCAERIQVNN